MPIPYHHAVSSARQFGGKWQDYMPIHEWFDESRNHHGDFRHRVLRHHTEGIGWMTKVFGDVLELSTCAICGKTAEDEIHASTDDGPRDRLHAFRAKLVPTRLIGQQHLREDVSFLPTASDWLEAVEFASWMNRGADINEIRENAQRAGRQDT